jgi:GNAT superfamily N-acetyltransferase
VAADLIVEPLDTGRHDRSAFACGKPPLDRYLKEQASQDIKRRANAIFVLADTNRPAEIIGYFTLCSSTLTQGEVPEATRKLVPRYPLVSATLIGRLAVAQAHHRKGFGGMLLERALGKAYEATAYVASCMVVVDAIDDEAVGFYKAFGFTQLPDSMRLVLPMQTVAKLPAAVAAWAAQAVSGSPAAQTPPAPATPREGKAPIVPAPGEAKAPPSGSP